MTDSQDKDFTDEDLYDDEFEDTQKDKYLTFDIGKSVYGIEIYYVIEIVGIQKITEVPDMPDFVKGVINLRGQVIPVMDVRIRFRMKQREYDDRTCVIVVRNDDTTIGLLVDTVKDVLDIPENDVSPPPKVSEGNSRRFIKGIGKSNDEVKILLDLNKLLFDETLDSLPNSSQS
ncbi:chemotaxis protein CheW [Desulfonema magnum]|uniref:Chemotaxis protein CheW n=1 Tax=Desulfonema magnum TaxID=45655 RepID=A0A975BP83_9BACT|nr:chemotaxis protein CheW [Desulfonema magnum]QTA88644.1 CheW-like domain containing-protein [Desulfonema magnum]